jgi:hypothetical protein
MEIQSGKLYENRTWKYLYPCLRSYTPKLTEFLATFFKLAVGIGDSNVLEVKNKCLFILIDTNIYLLGDRELSVYQERFSTFLDFIRYEPYYIKDYVYEGDGKKHMLVLKIPFIHLEAYDKFLLGKYSEMYSLKEINTLYKFCNVSDKIVEKKKNDYISECRAVLTKNPNHVEAFVKKVNIRFKTQATVEDFKDAEIDYPPNFKEEIFNYN